MAAHANLQPFAHVLAVQDMDRTSAYFRDALGFTVLWEDATDWRLLSRDGVKLMVGHCPDTPPARDIGDHNYFAYIHVDDVDALHREFTERGAIVLRAPFDQPYGLREMVVGTPDGHRMVFGQQRTRS